MHLISQIGRTAIRVSVHDYQNNEVALAEKVRSRYNIHPHCHVRQKHILVFQFHSRWSGQLHPEQDPDDGAAIPAGRVQGGEERQQRDLRKRQQRQRRQQWRIEAVGGRYVLEWQLLCHLRPALLKAALWNQMHQACCTLTTHCETRHAHIHCDLPKEVKKQR